MSTIKPANQESSVLAVPRPPVLLNASLFELHTFNAGTRRRPRDDIYIEGRKATTVKIMPRFYHHCELEDVVIMTSRVIEEAIAENDEKSQPLLTKGLTPFHSL